MQSMAEQEKRLELPEQPPTAADQAEPAGECKLRLVNRSQLTMAQVDVEHLIDEHHPARGIWEVPQGLDLSRYTILTVWVASTSGPWALRCEQGDFSPARIPSGKRGPVWWTRISL